MKFIIISQEIGNDMVEIVPLIFSKSIIHREVAERIINIYSRRYPKENTAKVISAGFYNSDGCYGESETLGIKSINGSNELIETNDYLNIINKNHNILKPFYGK